ncbi:nucleotide-diphospho-sugar transferase [Gallaecimonas mangrovi]|uniref:nucleotide-diphospho-sugar transferase n=1 Tax=Gallaecimonas mangrovi TaxID=2291597 RepID=UPI000E20BB1D|nr:nucleotide-diphospho-sugar transferase [Gallaecimonas mangrovi]
MSFKTPVLFLVFNRLDTTQQVFQRIREIKPIQFYIACDGARENKSSEKKDIEKVRQYILENIDWHCEVKTLFREQNLGCKLAVSSAIDWFFENEEQGIILEDDCLPSKSFFYFCQENLEQYKNDLRIWHVAGYRYPGLKKISKSYDFSRFTQVWGWASWRSRWKHYDVTLEKYKKHPNILRDLSFFEQKDANQSRADVLSRVVDGEINTWDYQWNFCVRINNGLAIRPSQNLVRNIGFNEQATHTFDEELSIVNNQELEIEFPLSHPEFIMSSKIIDDEFFKKFGKTSLYKKIIRKLRNISYVKN